MQAAILTSSCLSNGLLHKSHRLRQWQSSGFTLYTVVWPGCGFQMGSLSCMCLCMPDAAAPISKTSGAHHLARLLVADENGQIVVRSRSSLAPISEPSALMEAEMVESPHRMSKESCDTVCTTQPQYQCFATDMATRSLSMPELIGDTIRETSTAVLSDAWGGDEEGDPKQLWLLAPARGAVQGEYVLQKGRDNFNQPLWRQQKGSGWLFSSAPAPDGFWRFANSDVELADRLGPIQSAQPHDGAAPQKVASWQYYDGSGWHDDTSILVLDSQEKFLAAAKKQSSSASEEHPPSLWLLAPRYPNLQGEYRKQETRRERGQPVWRQVGGEGWIFSTSKRRWFITDDEAGIIQSGKDKQAEARAGVGLSAWVIVIDSSGESNMSDADEVMDMPVGEQGDIPALEERVPPPPLRHLFLDYVNNEPKYKDNTKHNHIMKIGYAPTYDPAADPWHENGMYRRQNSRHNMVHFNRASSTPTRTTPGKMNLISPLQFYLHNHISTHNNRGQPPTNTGDHNMDRHPNSELGTPDKEQHNGRGEPTLDNYPNIMEQRSDGVQTDCTAEEHEHTDENNDMNHEPDNQDQDADLEEKGTQEGENPHEDNPTDDQADLDWESDTSDGDDDDEDNEPEQTTPAQGRKAPKRAAGHGSQRLANKAKKSEVKKRWRELDWGKKPHWLSWRGAIPYIIRGEKPPAKQPLPPTPSPQREYLTSLLSARHYSYDEQGNIVPHHPPRPSATSTEARGEKASNQAKEDHAQRMATNPYRQNTGSTQPARPSTTASSSASGPTTRTRKQMDPTPPDQRQERRDPPPQPQPRPPQDQQARGRPRQPIQFQLPDDHREEPPRPVRRQDAWRRLTGSTTVQLTGDGVYKYPVQIVDNRPAPSHPTMEGRTQTNVQDDPENRLHNIEGDTLVVQPLHLTEDMDSSPSSSSTSHPVPPRDPASTIHSGGPPLHNMHDLDQQAAEAIETGRAPAWQVEGDGPSRRSSVRVDDNSHDISWVQGATPRTLPPPMPLHPRTVLSMRGNADGTWRGTTWSPPSQSVVHHPPRRQVEPTIVIYKTLASHQSRGVLPDGLSLTIYPAGEWIATTRFELGFARTPRFWLVTVEDAPQPVGGRLPIKPGDSFWLEWRGRERVWQRRPRFANDIQALGGLAVIPGAEPPRPPTPPQRRDPTVPSARTSFQGGFDPRRFVDTRPLRGRLIPADANPTSEAERAVGPTMHEPQRTPHDDPGRQQPRKPTTTTTGATTPNTPPHQDAESSKAAAKAKPPQPPAASPGSESETSWPSEDPTPPEDVSALHQRSRTIEKQPTTDTSNPQSRQGDLTSLVQRRLHDTAPSLPTAPSPGPPALDPLDPPQPPQPPSNSQQPPTMDPETQWYSVAANFDGEFTVSGLLRVLRKILHEMLQQTFNVPNEYLTHLAYHSCYYISKLQSTSEQQLLQREQGETPIEGGGQGPTAMVFCITNAFIEAEAALESLVQHQQELPRRHLLKELHRAEALVKDGRAVFKSWARNPNAPGALPGTAASQNALDGIDFAFLASEEGGTATLDESLQLALGAAQRCNRYMEELLQWIQSRFQDMSLQGSPSPKKRRLEQPSGSDCQPAFHAEAEGKSRTAEERTGLGTHRPLPVPALPVPAQARGQQDPGLPHRDCNGLEPGAAPYNILKAQQLLEAVIPFTEQEVATSLHDIHSLLSQWTTGLWGEPIVLTDSLEPTAATAAEPNNQEATRASTGGLIPATAPTGNSSDESETVASHRKTEQRGTVPPTTNVCDTLAEDDPLLEPLADILYYNDAHNIVGFYHDLLLPGYFPDRLHPSQDVFANEPYMAGASFALMEQKEAEQEPTGEIPDDFSDLDHAGDSENYQDDQYDLDLDHVGDSENYQDDQYDLAGGVDSSPRPSEPAGAPSGLTPRQKQRLQQLLAGGHLNRLHDEETDAMVWKRLGTRKELFYLRSMCLGLLIAALRPQVVELGCDASATGVVQQLFTVCSDRPALRAQLTESLGGSILKMSKDKHGCLAIQHALEMAPLEMQCLIGSELKGKVFYCSRHMHGNFVMQKIIQTLPPSALMFIVLELKETVVAAALHIYARRVLQRLIEHCGHRPELLSLLEDLMVPGEQLQRLVKDPYSSNVIRTLVVCGSVENARVVMRLFSEDVMKYSRNRHASLVLEKCLEVSAGPKASELAEDRATLMTAFFSSSTRSASPPLLQIMLDRFGNYIVQRVIETSTGAEKDEVKRLLTLAWPKLQNAAAGKHILSAANKKFSFKVPSDLV
ncbi:APUM5 [Symbiodinium sp. KB8]|nr:APUM5 [Symbiodinium sp. KB8]